MPSRYHPIEDGLWDDPKFDPAKGRPEAPGEERGFFAFLSSNKMQRPAGIYRATDEELAAASRIPIRRVKDYLRDLDARGLIVRDGSWVFCPGYWKRQAHNPGMLSAAKAGVQSCTSLRILTSFVQRYPLHREWLPNGFPTVAEPLGNPSHESESSSIALNTPVPMQSSTNADTEQSSMEPSALVGEEPTPPPPAESDPEPEDPEQLRAAWNEACALSRQKHPDLRGLIVCRDLTLSRRKKAVARLNEAELEWHRGAMTRLACSSLASGRPDRDGRKWRASIDWYLDNDTNAVKAAEGKYDD